jgi:hypothetical protein
MRAESGFRCRATIKLLAADYAETRGFSRIGCGVKPRSQKPVGESFFGFDFPLKHYPRSSAQSAKIRGKQLP